MVMDEGISHYYPSHILGVPWLIILYFLAKTLAVVGTMREILLVLSL